MEQQIPFEKIILMQRNQIIISYDNAKEVALRYFDDVVNELKKQIELNNALRETSQVNKVEPKTKKDKSRK